MSKGASGGGRRGDGRRDDVGNERNATNTWFCMRFCSIGFCGCCGWTIGGGLRVMANFWPDPGL